VISSGESLFLRTCNRDDGARLDLRLGYKGFQFLRWSVPIFSFWMLEQLTLMLLRIDLTITASMNVRSTERTKSEFMKLNTHISVLLCSQPLEAWVPPLQLHISVWLSFCLLSGRPLLQSYELVTLSSWLFSFAALCHHVR